MSSTESDIESIESYFEEQQRSQIDNPRPKVQLTPGKFQLSLKNKSETEGRIQNAKPKGGPFQKRFVNNHLYFST